MSGGIQTEESFNVCNSWKCCAYPPASWNAFGGLVWQMFQLITPVISMISRVAIGIHIALY